MRVFQSFALFPWLTVLDNVEAPLEARGVPAMERHKRALRILDTVGLDGFESAYPKELSGASTASSVIITTESPILISAWISSAFGPVNRSPSSAAPNARP